MQKDYENRNFEIFGSNWKLIYCDEVIEEGCNDTLHGLTDSSNNIISVSTKKPNKEDKDDNEIDITTLHELIHCILLSGQYNAYSEDEPFVEWTARCLYSFKKQGLL